MPQELQSTNQQSQTTVEEAKSASVTAIKNKVEQKPNKNDDTPRSLKRTAPTDVASQGDAKRKATQGSKKSSEKSIETANIKATDPTAIAANAAAILSSVPSSVAQNVVAVAPLISNQQNAINELSPPLHPNMEEYMSNAAVGAQAQPQDGSGKRSVSTRNLTNDERRQRRLLRNRVAAKECRRKKKAYVADLEEKVTRLEEENSRLSKEVDELSAKLNSNAFKLEENARLHKEIEELKAKLNTTETQRSKTNDVSKEDISADI